MWILIVFFRNSFYSKKKYGKSSLPKNNFGHVNAEKK